VTRSQRSARFRLFHVETKRRIGELGASCVAFVVRDVLSAMMKRCCLPTRIPRGDAGSPAAYDIPAPAVPKLTTERV
jgi:hypothetical protein